MRFVLYGRLYHSHGLICVGFVCLQWPNVVWRTLAMMLGDACPWWVACSWCILCDNSLTFSYGIPFLVRGGKDAWTDKWPDQAVKTGEFFNLSLLVFIFSLQLSFHDFNWISQRVDAEKPRHQTLITSDVRQQIMTMNRKAREEWEKRQAEAEKLQKVNDVRALYGTVLSFTIIIYDFIKYMFIKNNAQVYCVIFHHMIYLCKHEFLNFLWPQYL
jgi:hypothetical protein